MLLLVWGVTAKAVTTLYAFCLGAPSEPVRIKSLAGMKVADIALLGGDAKLDWKQEPDALVIQPASNWPCQHAVVFRCDLKQD